jgi:alkyl hydroperoxide reductase subunit F
LTAAVYASVLKIDTFLLTKDLGGQAIDSTKIKNYMGFDFITGKDLVKKFREQFLEEHYLDHKVDEVIRIDRADDGFHVITKEDEEYLASAVIVATGMKRRTLGIPGEERLQRKGIAYSSAQDITLWKGFDIVVIGGGNSGVQTAIELEKIGCNVTLVSEGLLTADPSDIEVFRSSDGVEVLEGYSIIEILGDDRVTGVTILSRENRTSRTISCGGVFIQIGFRTNIEFCEHLADLNDKREIVIGPDNSTRTGGLFAAGDVTNAYGKRIIIASGEGAKAALRAKKYLLQLQEGPSFNIVRRGE